MSYAILFAGIFIGTFAASGLFFIKFWKASRDQFYLHFALAFFLLCIERILSIVTEINYSFISTNSDKLAWIYLIRLFSFLLIVYAILKKNKIFSRKQ